jgi:hypothetical protein
MTVYSFKFSLISLTFRSTMPDERQTLEARHCGAYCMYFGSGNLYMNLDSELT